MEQLWYTWSTVGLGSVTGHRVRAASPGLQDLHGERYREIAKHLRYALPDDVNPYDVTTDFAPYSLAYIVTKHGPLLLHRVYAGEDAYGRAGVFFVHALADFDHDGNAPHNSITPLDAIDSWQSSFWKTSDTLPENRVDLLAVREIDPGPLDVTAVMRVKPNQRCYQENLEKLVLAYLMLEDNQNIYLETYAEDGIHAATERNAELIWGLLHCLPPFLAERATFSTYEEKLSGTPATRIVATCFSSRENLQREPRHPGIVFKLDYGADGSTLLSEDSAPRASITKSSLRADQRQSCNEYARHAVRLFLFPDANDQKTLQDLYEMLHDWNINSLSSFLAVYPLFATNKFDASQIDTVLQPENAVVILPHNYAREALLSYMVDHGRWWSDTGKGLWSELAAYAEETPHLPLVLAELALFVGERISDELMQHNTYKACVYLSLLEIVAPSEKQPEPWMRLLENLAPFLRDNEQQHSCDVPGDKDLYHRILLDCASIREVSDEALYHWLCIARAILKPTELSGIFVRHWAYLLNVAPNDDIVRGYVECFLDCLTASQLLNAKNLGDILDALGEHYPAPKYSSTIKNWQLVRKILFMEYDTKARKVITNEKELHLLATATSELKLQEDRIYWDALFHYIVLAIQSSDDLELVVALLSPLLPCDVGFDGYSVDVNFIEHMSPYVNKEYLRKKDYERLLVYIQLAISEVQPQEKTSRGKFKLEENLKRIFQKLWWGTDEIDLVESLAYIDEKEHWECADDLEREKDWMIWKRCSEDLRRNKYVRLPSFAKREIWMRPALHKRFTGNDQRRNRDER